MAFLTGDVKEYIACCQAYAHAETTLAAWLQGQERYYAVRFVLDEFRELFGPGAALPVALIERAARLHPDDEKERARLVTKALDLIGQQLRATRALTHVPYRDD